MSQPLAEQPGRRTQPNIVYIDEHHCTALVGNVLVSYSTAEPTRGYLENWIAHAKLVAKQHGRIGGLVVIDRHAKPPSDAIRVEMDEALKSLGGHVAAMAHVIEGEGFLAAAKRSALTMLTLLARLSFPVKIFAEPLAAAAWLVGQLGSSRRVVEFQDLRAAADSVREAKLSKYPAR